MKNHGKLANLTVRYSINKFMNIKNIKETSQL